MNLLKIGDIAKKTGLTIRALHHYDEIGLVTPRHRSDTSYRLYTREDLIKLQKIKSLQQLGFSLEDIASLLKSDKESLAEIINKHLQYITLQLKQQQELVKRLRQLADILQQSTVPTVELLLDTLKVTVMFEKYYSAEQMERLAARQKKIGENAINEAQQEWQDIFEQFRILHKNKEPASCEAAQKLAKRSLQLIDIFTGGDPEIKQSLNNMYTTEGGENILNQTGMEVDEEFFSYVSKAMELAKKK